MRTGLFCAIAGANTSADAVSAPTAAADLSKFRRDSVMEFLPEGLIIVVADGRG